MCLYREQGLGISYPAVIIKLSSLISLITDFSVFLDVLLFLANNRLAKHITNICGFDQTKFLHSLRIMAIFFDN